ncbi:MAG: T9SS type A sorting domain-containing protein, partial [Flavobacteriaceae bacterium]|nr:T9SS type A sorting domain-containing protein [Flavobacteriaceae bacterium]
ASPNPFTDGFNLDVRSNSSEAVSIAVYDMTGRLLETKDVSVEDMSTQTIGYKYPAGVYNLVVSQGDDVRTVRVVKQ